MNLLQGLLVLVLVLFEFVRALPLDLSPGQGTVLQRLPTNEQTESDNGNSQDLERSIKDRQTLDEEASHTIRQVYRREEPGAVITVEKLRLEPRHETPDYGYLRSRYRQEANAYEREYGGPRNKEKRERLRRNEGSQQELERFHMLRNAANIYSNAIYHLRRLAKDSGSKAPELTLEQGEALREYANAYDREFGRRYSREEIAELKAGRGDPKVLERFNELYENARTFRNWEGRMYKRREKVAEDSGMYTPEELKKIEDLRRVKDVNREGHSLFAKKFIQGKDAKALAARLRARQGTETELEEFDSLLKSYRAYISAADKIRRLGRLTHIDIDENFREGIEKLEELRQDHNAYRREFSGKENEKKRAELEAGVGPPDVVERYKRLRPGYLAYTRLYMKGLKTSRQESVEGPQDASEEGNLKDKSNTRKARGQRRYFRPNIRTRKKQEKSEKSEPNLEEDRFQFGMVDSTLSELNHQGQRIPADQQSELTKSINCDRIVSGPLNIPLPDADPFVL